MAWQEKLFGIFAQRVLDIGCPLMDGLSPEFPMPNSRHTEVRHDEVEQAMKGTGHIVAEGTESGVGVVTTTDLKRVLIVGHLEYEPFTLDKEYHRDLSKGLPIQKPVHYYTPSGDVDYSWCEASHNFYRNWVRKACAEQ